MAVRNSPVQRCSPQKSYVGLGLDAKDGKGFWCDARVIKVDTNKRLLKVHFIGWHKRHDAWVDSSNVAAHGTFALNAFVNPATSFVGTIEELDQICGFTPLRTKRKIGKRYSDFNSKQASLIVRPTDTEIKDATETKKLTNKANTVKRALLSVAPSISNKPTLRKSKIGFPFKYANSKGHTLRKVTSTAQTDGISVRNVAIDSPLQDFVRKKRCYISPKSHKNSALNLVEEDSREKLARNMRRNRTMNRITVGKNQTKSVAKANSLASNLWTSATIQMKHNPKELNILDQNNAFLLVSSLNLQNFDQYYTRHQRRLDREEFISQKLENCKWLTECIQLSQCGL